MQRLHGWLESPGRRRIAPPLGMAAAFAVAFFCVYEPAVPDFAVQLDTVDHLLAVRDCAGGNACLVRLTPFGATSVLGIAHGALTVHVIAAVFLLGGDLHHLLLLATLGWAAAVLLVVWLAARFLGTAHGVVAGSVALWLWSAVYPLPGSSIWNPAYLPVPAALFLASALCFISTRRLRFLAGAALAVGVGVQFHLAAGATAIGLGLLVAIAPRGRRWLAGALAAGLPAAAVLFSSPGMVAETRIVEAFSGGGPPPVGQKSLVELTALVGLAVLVGVGLVLARRLESERRSAQSAGLTFALVTYLPPALLFAWKAPDTARYVSFLVPGLAYLIAGTVWLAARLLRAGLARAHSARLRLSADRAARVAVVVAVGLAVVNVGRLMRTASVDRAGRAEGRGVLDPLLGEVEALAHHLERDLGWSFEDGFRHLRGGPGHHELVAGLSLYMPAGEASDTVDEDVTVLRLPSSASRGALPPGWLPLGHGLASHHYTPILDWDTFEICWAAGRAPCRWQALEYVRASRVDEKDAHRWIERQQPHVPELLGSTPCPGVVAMRVPIRVPAGAEERHLVVPAFGGGQSCRGGIVDVSGIQLEENLPTTALRIHGAKQAQQGTVTFAWDLCAGVCAGGMNLALPPPVLELDAESAAFWATLPQSGPPVGTQRWRIDPRSDPDAPAGGSRLSRSAPPEPLAPLAWVMTCLVLAVAGLLAATVACVRCPPPDRS